MNWSHFLIAIRWQNVFIIWLMQTVVFYSYLLPYCGKDSYSFASFLLFLVASGAILGGGNIYNDLRDISTDAVHPGKPGLIGKEVSTRQAWIWYYILTVTSLLCLVTGIWIYSWSYFLGIVFLTGIAALILYSNRLKSTILIGNVVVAILCATSVWMTTLLMPDCDLGTTINTQHKIPLILYGYLANAFSITLLREIIKDKEDASFDIQSGVFTVGSIGEIAFRRVFNGVLLANFMLNGTWFYLLKDSLTPQNLNLGLLFIFIPLILIGLIFNLPHRPKVHAFLSKLIKVYILFAILLLIIWQKT